ncbi:MAG: AAA family ATPase [Chloroflexi bacterium]|nr:AAA family ATPase [Chloroflexota bacterium]
MNIPLIGRQHELDSLRREFQNAARGRTTFVLLSGEPGVGKSHLLAEVARLGEAEGARALRGQCLESEGMPPYLPFLEALGEYMRTAPQAQLRRQTGANAHVLATLFPEILQRLGDLSPLYDLPPEQARFRLYEAIAAFFRNLCEGQPALLLFDDLQWADAASLDLLAYIVRHQPSIRLLILAAARPGEGETNAPFQRLLSELDRLRHLNVIEIPPLSAEEIAGVAAHLLGAPLEAQACRLLHEWSEGNPFFAEELLRGWQEAGRMRRAESFWILDPLIEGQLPRSILRAIEGRLARLPLSTLEKLRVAAILGRRFESRLLADALGQEVETVEEHLQPAVWVHLLRAEGETYAFYHDTVREALYRQVIASRRQRLHGFIGRALEARSAPRDGVLGLPKDVHHLADLAFHFSRSGDREHGVHYARLAAEEALRAFAPLEAVRHYQSALHLIEQMKEAGLPIPSQKGELVLGLGEAALQTGMEAEAIAAFQSAQAWFEQRGDPLAAGRAAHGLGRALWQTESIPAAQQAFESALNLLGEEVSAESAQAHTNLADLLVLSLNQYDEGMTHAERALEMARRLEDEHLTISALRALGNFHVRANHLAEGIDTLENALSLAIEADDPSAAAETCTALLMALGWSALFKRAIEIARQLTELAERCQTRYYLRHVYSLLAHVHMQQGKVEKSRQSVAQAREVVEHLASPEPQAFLNLTHGYLAYIVGDYPAMQDFISRAVSVFRSFGPEALIWYLGMDGLARLYSGHHVEARACRDELETLLRQTSVGAFPAAEALAHLALFSLELGERERLLNLYPRLLPFRGQYHDGLMDRLLGAIEILQKDWDKAQASLGAAEMTARREGIQWELAKTLASRADLELARGGAGSAARARALLAEALAIFKTYGNAEEQKRIRARLRDLPRQPGEKLPQPAPAGLSRRQVEILKLLAAGKSNRKIADELALSEKTVANHVTMIFNKIGVENRAAAAAFATRQGLV